MKSMIMMVPRGRDDEIYIRLVSSCRDRDQKSRGPITRDTAKGPTQEYCAYIYTNLNLSGIGRRLIDRFRLFFNKHVISKLIRLGNKDAATIPLVAVEQVGVKWSRYQDYLATFLDGSKEPDRMTDRLFETISPGLQELFSGRKLADRPVRVWWTCEPPELEDLPWELLAYRRRDPSPDFSFVRGQPPSTPVPKVPLSGPLRLAFVHDPSFTPPWLQTALTSLEPGIQVIELAMPPRQALETAVREGYELVHLVADGLVSLAYEGVLYLCGTTSPEISASELSSIFKGSRVSVLSLTEPETQKPDTVRIGRYEVPSVYRGFAYLNRATFPLPNIVAPLGPHHPEQMVPFWHNFYTALNESLQVEKAMAEGRGAGPPVAMALYLRQSQRLTFKRLKPGQKAPAVDPSQVYTDLQQSREMVSQLKTLEKSGDMPESVKRFLDKESARQVKLKADLDPWTKGEDDKS